MLITAGEQGLPVSGSKGPGQGAKARVDAHTLLCPLWLGTAITPQHSVREELGLQLPSQGREGSIHSPTLS